MAAIIANNCRNAECAQEARASIFPNLLSLLLHRALLFPSDSAFSESLLDSSCIIATAVAKAADEEYGFCSTRPLSLPSLLTSRSYMCAGALATC